MAPDIIILLDRFAPGPLPNEQSWDAPAIALEYLNEVISTILDIFKYLKVVSYQVKPTPESDRQVYELAKNYLPSLKITGVTQTLIEKYQKLSSQRPRPLSKEELYRHLLEHAQNTGMKRRVIGESIGGVDRLGIVLYKFNPTEVLAAHGDNWQSVLDLIVKELRPKGKIRTTPRSIWPRYCQTILSAAGFIDQFASVDDFFSWVDFFDRDDRSRASLPMLLDHEIKGFGFALSCDFLKELGYVNFPKPDVHLRDIFTALELCPDGTDDYHLFKAIVRVASHSNVTPYAADKVFWLIGSGNFYEDKKEIGSNGYIGGNKIGFIEFARQKMSEDK
jgi:hypothetical protein